MANFAVLSLVKLLIYLVLAVSEVLPAPVVLPTVLHLALVSRNLLEVELRWLLAMVVVLLPGAWLPLEPRLGRPTPLPRVTATALQPGKVLAELQLTAMPVAA